MYPSPDPRIFCLLAATEAHPGLAAGIPPAGVLSPTEQSRYEALAVPKRRRDWLLGRWTAKHLLQAYVALTQDTVIPLSRLEVLPAGDGAPVAYVGEALKLSLSISHSGSESFCALCASEAGQVGADVEQVESRDLSFVRTFFTPAENDAAEKAGARERDALISALWSTKEAVLKTLRLGLRADTRQVEVRIASLGPQWSPAVITLDPALLPSPSATISAWCLAHANHVLSLGLLHVD